MTSIILLVDKLSYSSQNQMTTNVVTLPFVDDSRSTEEKYPVPAVLA